VTGAYEVRPAATAGARHGRKYPQNAPWPRGLRSSPVQPANLRCPGTEAMTDTHARLFTAVASSSNLQENLRRKRAKYYACSTVIPKQTVSAARCPLPGITANCNVAARARDVRFKSCSPCTINIAFSIFATSVLPACVRHRPLLKMEGNMQGHIQYAVPVQQKRRAWSGVCMLNIFYFRRASRLCVIAPSCQPTDQTVWLASCPACMHARDPQPVHPGRTRGARASCWLTSQHTWNFLNVPSNGPNPPNKNRFVSNLKILLRWPKVFFFGGGINVIKECLSCQAVITFQTRRGFDDALAFSCP